MEEIELRIKITDKNFKDYGEKVLSALEGYAKNVPSWSLADDNHDGIRILQKSDECNGWFLLRLSVHDPIMPLNIEGDTFGATKMVANKLINFLTKFDKLDLSTIINFIEK